MTAPRARSPWPQAFGLLVLAYLAQSVSLYRGGGEPREWAALSARARAGQVLWRAHACHSCHQIHGLGGFLGPDLTNVVRRRTPEEIGEVLADGRKQMPAFRMSEEAIESLVQFFVELDSSGTSTAAWQPAGSRSGPWPSAFRFADRERTAAIRGPLAAAEGLFEVNGCAKCHLPFAVGKAGAPDLTLTRSLWAVEDVADMLRDSRGAMPGYPDLTERDRELIAKYVDWLGRHRAGLAAGIAGPAAAVSWRKIPWFEIP